MISDLIQPSFFPRHLITIFFILIILITSHAINNKFIQCNRSSHCGTTIRNITYPFYGGSRPSYCGRQGFELICPEPNNQTEHPTIRINDLNFTVIQVYNDYMMKIARADFNEKACPTGEYVDTTLNYALFNYTLEAVGMLSVFYNCGDIASPWDQYAFSCNSNKNDSYFRVDERLPSNASLAPEPSCEKRLKVPVLRGLLESLALGKESLQEAISQGFDVEYKRYQQECDECKKSAGICGSDSVSHNFVCYCGNGVCTNQQEEDIIARQMMIVGLWCIQAMPVDRPSISRVIEMLEGSIESLKIPPRPATSAPRSQVELSSASTYSTTYSLQN